ncbi:MAG: sel1 repeat family protein, partial [Clostridia bacterium]|nr:sel1 repeat family protein [Clostridia bacterium]
MVDELKKLYKGYEKGDVDSAFNLGQVYFLGLLGQEVNYYLAFKAFMLAAEQNHVLALANVGYCYEFGLGVKKDLFKAEEYYKQAEKLGSLTAKCNLLHLYETGQLKADKQYDFFQEYKILALKGDVRAKYKVGKILGEKSIKNALPYLKPIAEDGYVPAQIELFNLYNKALFEDYSKELNYWATKLLDANYPYAYYVKGKAFINGEQEPKNVNKGLELLKKGAKLGDKRCCLFGGLCYYNGEIVGRNYKNALEFFEMGVKLGCAECAGYASIIYGSGIDVKRDKDKAFKYGAFSASEGVSKGYLALAKCYLYGYGTNIDYEQAYNNLCYCEEDEENDFTWGWLYHNGFYLKKDLKRAGEQYRTAFAYKYNNFYALGVYLSFSIE